MCNSGCRPNAGHWWADVCRDGRWHKHDDHRVPRQMAEKTFMEDLAVSSVLAFQLDT